MLKKNVEAALNQQIETEAAASFLYLALASWCDMKGFEGSASFMYAQSEEERVHMLKLFRYINHSGGYAQTPEITRKPADYQSLSQIFRIVYESEIKVTESVNELVDLCTRERDYATLNFIQWYVSEQHEEEVLFKSILDKIELVGEDGMGIFMFDQYMKTVKPEDPAASGGEESAIA